VLTVDGSGDDMVGLMSHSKVQRILEGEELVLSAHVSKLGKGKLGVAAKEAMQNRVLAVTRTSVRDLDQSNYQTKHRIPLEELLSYSVNREDFRLKVKDSLKEFSFWSEHSQRICDSICQSYESLTGRQLRSAGWQVAGPATLEQPEERTDHSPVVSATQDPNVLEVEAVESVESVESGDDESEPDTITANEQLDVQPMAEPLLPAIPVCESREEVLAAIYAEEVRHHALLDAVDDVLDTLKLRCDGKADWPDWVLHELAFSTGPAVLGEFLDMSEFVVSALQTQLRKATPPSAPTSATQLGAVYLDAQLEPYLSAYAENYESLGLVAAELRTIQRDHPPVRLFLMTEGAERVAPYSDGTQQTDFETALAAPQAHLHRLIALLEQLRDRTEPVDADYSVVCRCLERLVGMKGGTTGMNAAFELERSIVLAAMTPVQPHPATAAPPWDSHIRAAGVVDQAQTAAEIDSDSAAREKLHERALASLSKSRHEYTIAIKEAPAPPEMVTVEEMEEAIQMCEDRFAKERLQLETDVAGLRVQLQAAESQRKQDATTIAQCRQRLQERAEAPPPAPPPAPSPAPALAPPVEGALSIDQQEAVVLQLRELEAQLEASHSEISNLRAEKKRQTARTAGLQQQLRAALGREEEEKDDEDEGLVDPAVTAELRALRVSELRARATTAGVEQAVLDEADDSDDTHAALVSILVNIHAEKEAAVEEARLEDIAALQRALREKTDAQETLQTNFELASKEFAVCVERCCAEVAAAEAAQRHAEARAQIAEDEARRLLGEVGEGVLPLSERNALRMLFDVEVKSAAHPSVSTLPSSSSPARAMVDTTAGSRSSATRSEGGDGVLGRKQLGRLLKELQLVESESSARADEIFSQLWRDAGVGWEALVATVEACCTVEGTARVGRRIRAAAAKAAEQH
jgi:hypothetical protein